MNGYHYCERCTMPVYAGQGVVAYTLEDRETVIHRDINICEYNISSDPDVVPAPARMVVAGVREPEPRMTAAVEQERGWWR